MSYLVILILLIVSSYIYVKIAERFDIIDRPNYRSSHAVSTIRGGGILFFIAVLLFFVKNDFQYLYFVLGLTLIAVISFIDDVVTLSSRIRLPFQFIAVLLIFFQVGIGFCPIFWFAFLIIVNVLFINIYNFMDGINGITGFYSLSVLFGLYLVNSDVGLINNDLIIYVVLALVVFGYYNFRKKARFFAGDVGSISAAMIIMFICLSLLRETEAPLILFTIVVYGADALFTLLVRLIKRQKLTVAHRNHIYQKLVDIKGMSHLKVSAIYAITQLVVNIIIYKTYKLDQFTQYLIVFFFVISFSLIYLVLYRKTKLITS